MQDTVRERTASVICPHAPVNVQGVELAAVVDAVKEQSLARTSPSHVDVVADLALATTPTVLKLNRKRVRALLEDCRGYQVGYRERACTRTSVCG